MSEQLLKAVILLFAIIYFGFSFYNILFALTLKLEITPSAMKEYFLCSQLKAEIIIV